jgi:hypothetical protein
MNPILIVMDSQFIGFQGDVEVYSCSRAKNITISFTLASKEKSRLSKSLSAIQLDEASGSLQLISQVIYVLFHSFFHSFIRLKILYMFRERIVVLSMTFELLFFFRFLYSSVVSNFSIVLLPKFILLFQLLFEISPFTSTLIRAELNLTLRNFLLPPAAVCSDHDFGMM